MKKKRIIFVIPSLSAGGMERVMSEVVTYFSNKPTVKCHLIIYGKPESAFYQVPKNVQIYKPNFTFDETRRTRDTIKTILFIRRTVKQLKGEALLSFGEYWNNLVLLSLLGLKTPVFVSDRSSPQKHLGIIHNFLRRLLYPTAAGIILQTSKAKEILKKKFKNKNIKVIGNPIRPITSKNGINRENIIITVGRLITSKNINHMINIFADLKNSDWKLVIVGGDSNKETNSISLKAQIDSLGLSANIILAGPQKNIEEHLLKAKIFTFTSSSEGFPNVIGEAMSAGLPVVSYDCVAGPSDMIKDGKNGFLIPLFDDHLFTEKLLYLMNNENERAMMGTYASKSIQSFSVDSIGAQFFDFILGQKPV